MNKACVCNNQIKKLKTEDVFFKFIIFCLKIINKSLNNKEKLKNYNHGYKCKSLLIVNVILIK